MGMPIRILGFVLYFFCGLWGFVMGVGIIKASFGWLGIIVAFLLAPITLSLAPWYEGFAHGNWLPLVIIYGGGIVGNVLIHVANSIDGLSS